MLWLIVNFFSTLLLSVLWAVASKLTKGLVSQGNEGKLRLRARLILGIMGFSFLLSLAQAIVWIRLGAWNWLFIEDKVLMQLPLLLFPVVAILLYTFPLLLNIRKQVQSGSTLPISDEMAVSLSAAKFIVPVKAAALGALTDLLLTLLNPQSPVEFANLFVVWLMFSGVILVLWVLQRRIQTIPLHGFPGRVGSVVPSALVLSIIAIWITFSMQVSRLPGAMNMMEGQMEYGGGAPVMHDMSSDHALHSGSGSVAKTISVTELKGPQSGTPDLQFTLTAQKKQVILSSGKKTEAWTFNGLLPGPELRMKQGDLVEVILVNLDIEDGVTLHWHGLDVPNGEDGVAGLTQDAVMPGETYTYRFLAKQVGTFWYHSHQSSSEQVKKGLFGVLIVEPKEDAAIAGMKEFVIARHSWETSEGSATAFGAQDSTQRIMAMPGTPVKLRLLNAEDWPKSFYLTGVRYQVTAIDGVELNAPTDLENRPMLIAAGGRYEVTFTMPNSTVVLTNLPGTVSETDAALVLSPDGKGDTRQVPEGKVFEPWNYGSAGSMPFGLNSKFAREYVMVLDNKAGFYDGKFNFLFTINGKVFPNTQMFMVREGELIKTTFVNRSFLDHPMHLHGHHMLVLTRNGKPVSGSQWWTDTLNVAPGETYEVAFRADNPGIWMDHCHNLEHAAVGMTMHLAYEGVTSPYEIGHKTLNHPE